MRRESGQGMLLALMVLVIMMTALGLLASSMRMSVLEDKRGFRTVSLIAMSDAVMAETLGYLADDQDFEGVEQREFGDGTISSTVHPYGTWRGAQLAPGDPTSPGYRPPHYRPPVHRPRPPIAVPYGSRLRKKTGP